VEVWAVDRRANLLEDLRGMHTAERLNDPEIAARYYNDRDLAIGDRSFSDPPAATDPSLAYMSEWGLASTLNDLRAVINRVPNPREHVVLMGHSLGASIVEAYAAWDFDGTPGYRSIAGLALVDGVAGGGDASEDAWRNGAASGIPGVGSVGVTALRAMGPRYFALPILGILRALWGLRDRRASRAAEPPTRWSKTAARDSVFRLLLGVSPVPAMTNAAALGFAFDDRSCPLAFARMSCGAATGGTVGDRPNPFAMGETLSAPTDSSATYRWTDAPAREPAGVQLHSQHRAGVDGDAVELLRVVLSGAAHHRRGGPRQPPPLGELVAGAERHPRDARR
jgi:hypothetical protein